MSNNILEETVVNDEHAQMIMQTMYDGQVGTGYVRFCECKVSKTEDLTGKTKHGLLYDWDETGTHVVGMEILHFPVGGMRLSPLSVDLAFTQLSTNQKKSILAKFVK